jgi:nucleotide-binding universal stress UspA family protein
LPRLGKLFFQRFNGRALEFQFILVVLFVSALTAELIGVHEVVGAFLAGLAINATLPRHSPVTGHVLFMGESFFIPVFLLYSGMITNPVIFLESPQTILVALGVTVVAYVSKFVAAWLTARIFRYTSAELWTTYGLSHAQAAVTIPTLVIGLNTGLFDITLFNAAILMILLTSITSPLLVQRFAPELLQVRPNEEPLPLFGRILVPVTDPPTQAYLVELGSLLSKVSGGKLMVLNVALDERGQIYETRSQQELLGRVPEILNDPGTQVELIPRLADSYAQGILQTSRERSASLLLMGWRGRRSLQQSILGSVLDEVIWGSDTPVMIGKLSQPLNGMRRVLLILPAKVLAPVVLRRMLEANLILSKALNVPLDILTDGSYLEQVRKMVNDSAPDYPCTVEQLIGELRPKDLEKDAEGDLLVVPGFGSRQRFLASLGNLPERLAASFSGNLIILHFDR